MKAVRCSNGHWYDSETYSQCPHCGQSNTAAQNQSVSMTPKSKRGFSWFGGKSSTASSTPVGNFPNYGNPVCTPPAGYQPIFETDKKTEILEPMSLTHEEVTEQFFADIDDGKTMSLFEARDNFEVSPATDNVYQQEVPAVTEETTHQMAAVAVEPAIYEENVLETEPAIQEEDAVAIGDAISEETSAAIEVAPQEEITLETGDVFDEGDSFDTGDAVEQTGVIEIENVPAEEVAPEEKIVSEPLAAAVQRVSAMDEGKTLSYFNAMTNQNDTAGATVAKKPSNPVVGWLVAVSGAHLGDSFQLYVGKNAIGRGEGNKVVLALDQSVSRENHAMIIYEPKRREFYLQSGNSDGLVYLNDSFVSGLQLLNNKDVLEVGSSKLMFVPLCGTEFSWEQYM